MPKHPVIGIVMATMLEAKPFVVETPMERVEKNPVKLYAKDSLLLVLSGIGKANAAMATFHCCQKYAPDMVVNLGAAGATASGFKLGEIFHISRIVEYDRPNFKDGSPHVYKPLVIDGFPVARTATQDKPVILPEDRRKISRIADLVEMEAASVIQAANKFQIPSAFFKFVTDTPEHTGDKDIVNHIREYRDAFHAFFMEKILPALIARRLPGRTT